MTIGPQPDSLAVNVSGVVEHPTIGPAPYRVDIDGRPYLPVGDGGIVLGAEWGAPVRDLAGDHVFPGVTIGHPDPAARFALTAYSCIGNPVRVVSGAATGARGWVLGKRGEDGRVLVWFAAEDLARLRPGDRVSVRAHGQGHRHAETMPNGVALLNMAPGLLSALPVTVATDAVTVGVRAAVPSQLAGNGIGRPAQLWDLDLAFPPGDEDGDRLCTGDLVAVRDLDVRFNMGYRRGWLTVGIVGHGDSPMPGHGPGITPVATGPAAAFDLRVDPQEHRGLTGDVVSDLHAKGA